MNTICTKCGGTGNDGSPEELDCLACNGLGEARIWNIAGYLNLLLLAVMVVLFMFIATEPDGCTIITDGGELIRCQGTENTGLIE